jgi:DNA-binding response OmpR family regulator
MTFEPCLAVRPDQLCRTLAVIIEPQADLGDVLHEFLTGLGFDVTLAVTHVGAAQAVIHRHPALLLACVPAAAEDRTDAYLAKCRQRLGELPTVLMLSDLRRPPDAPIGATALLKPFTPSELCLAMDGAMTTADRMKQARERTSKRTW